MALTLTLAVGFLLAYANGANDNFKGVATLFGSGASSYRNALAWATLATLFGSATAIFAARGLLAAFSGKGLLPEELVTNPDFPLAVALAAAPTVLLASRLGFPVSTTHALLGGLVGAGLVASPTGIDMARLGQGFLLPLLASPALAVLAIAILHPALTQVRRRLGPIPAACVCVSPRPLISPSTGPNVMVSGSLASLTVGTQTDCRATSKRAIATIDGPSALHVAHYLSAGAVSFARGLNDTPKIAALLLVGGASSPTTALIGVAIAMALGGTLGARRVAETMSHRITSMTKGQGLVANAVTSLLVVGASLLALPVSTTHVSCGALFGLGAVTGQARWRAIVEVLLAWVITLPVAIVLGALAMSRAM